MGSRVIVSPVLHDVFGALTSEPLLADVEVTPTKITSSLDPLRRILLVGCALHNKLLVQITKSSPVCNLVVNCIQKRLQTDTSQCVNFVALNTVQKYYYNVNALIN